MYRFIFTTQVSVTLSCSTTKHSQWNTSDCVFLMIEKWVFFCSTGMSTLARHCTCKKHKPYNVQNPLHSYLPHYIKLFGYFSIYLLITLNTFLLLQFSSAPLQISQPRYFRHDLCMSYMHPSRWWWRRLCCKVPKWRLSDLVNFIPSCWGNTSPLAGTEELASLFTSQLPTGYYRVSLTPVWTDLLTSV